MRSRWCRDEPLGARFTLGAFKTTLPQRSESIHNHRETDAA